MQSQHSIDDGVLDLMRAAGASDDVVERAAAQIPDADPDHCEVDPDIWPVVKVFAELGSQWEWTSLGLSGAQRTALPTTRIGVYLDKTIPRRRHRRYMRELLLMAQAVLEYEREQRASSPPPSSD